MADNMKQCQHCGKGLLILIDEDEQQYECLNCSTETVVISESEILAAIFSTEEIDG